MSVTFTLISMHVCTLQKFKALKKVERKFTKRPKHLKKIVARIKLYRKVKKKLTED